MISADEPVRKIVTDNGKSMANVGPGEGDPIVFQRSNPTSCILWRNIMPRLAPQARCIAVDFMGMGDPDKLNEVDADSGLYIY